MGLGTGLAAASLLTPAGAAAVEAIYVARSGSAPESYCLGALVTGQVEAEKAGIARLRQDLNYARVLRAKSTDRRKAEFGKRMIDRLVDGQSLSFHAIIAPAGLGAAEQDVRRQLLQAINAAGVPVFMTAQTPRAISKRSLKIAQSIRSELPLAATVQFRHAKDDDLMQLAGLLAALVRLDRANAAANANAPLLAYLKLKLKAGRLDEATLKDHPKFRVFTYQA